MQDNEDGKVISNLVGLQIAQARCLSPSLHCAIHGSMLSLVLQQTMLATSSAVKKKN
jgi:hypothetical protein